MPLRIRWTWTLERLWGKSLQKIYFEKSIWAEKMLISVFGGRPPVVTEIRFRPWHFRFDYFLGSRLNQHDADDDDDGWGSYPDTGVKWVAAVTMKPNDKASKVPQVMTTSEFNQQILQTEYDSARWIFWINEQIQLLKEPDYPKMGQSGGLVVRVVASWHRNPAFGSQPTWDRFHSYNQLHGGKREP